MITSVKSTEGDLIQSPYMPSEIAVALKEKIPGVEEVCRLRSTAVWIGIDNTVFREDVGFTDSSFLKMFDFEIIAGDRGNPLSEPKSILLTEEVADKFFGDTINSYDEIIGLAIEFPESVPNEYQITGILADPPENNSFNWTVLVPYDNAESYPQCNTFTGNSSVYIMLDEENDIARVEETSQTLIDEFHGEVIQTLIHLGYIPEVGNNARYSFQSFNDLYLGSSGFRSCYEKTGSKRSIYILSSIALLILLIACYNYIMISVSSSLNRLRDFGMMNVVGAKRSQLLLHFIIESLLLVMISVFLGIILAEEILPLFNLMAQDDLKFKLFSELNDYLFIILLILFIVFFTSTYIGIQMLRNNRVMKFLSKDTVRMKRNNLARFSVVLQYFIAIALLISGGVILKQLYYMIKQDVGFNKENVIVLPVDFPDSKIIALKEKILESPHVLGVTMSDRNFVSGSSSRSLKNRNGDVKGIRFLKVDPDYITTLGIELISGRNFFEGEVMDGNNYVLVNETLIKELDLQGDPVGQNIHFETDDLTLTIIGVVKDFHFDSMKDDIEPLIMHISVFNSFWVVFIKTDENYKAALDHARSSWMKVVPEYTWDYDFLSDKLETQYENEDRWSKIIAYAAGVALFLSCLGLMGISSIIIARRFKEVGIRKANGASVTNIMVLLNYDLLKWVLVSYVMACPVSYLIMNKWLQGFAIRTDISWWIYMLAGIAAIIISVLTISIQVYRVAIQNPVKALRYE